MLKVENIRKTYGKEVVLDGISFELPKPEIVALVGPNGSGKSTLMNIITNLTPPDNGTVTVLGKPNTSPSIFKDISFMQDNTVLYEYLTGYDHLQFIADVQSLPEADILETSEIIGNKPYLNKKVKNYSLGMKQHLLLAMAILNKPKLLILDEPLNGLDPTSAIRVRNLLLQIQERGTAILLSSHNLGEIDQVTNKILFLKDGMLIQEKLTDIQELNYNISVDNTSLALSLLKEKEIIVSVDNDRLGIKVQNSHTLQRTLEALYSGGVLITDIEKKRSGSEERYRQIYEQKVNLP
ncbi:ABC transporter ATP-binding protein [Oceanobacillus kapialis]|uniref:ABC transporter ATP-binding protein n=1 Tax=Oceanobacillus kapialis TaxID=481353 RepID=A0ABW5PXB3_9BACI